MPERSSQAKRGPRARGRARKRQRGRCAGLLTQALVEGRVRARISGCHPSLTHSATKSQSGAVYTVDNHGLGIGGGNHSSVYAYAFSLAANSVPEPVIVLFLGLVSPRVAWSPCRAAPCASQRTPSALSLRPKLALRRIEQCLRAGALRTLLRSSEDRRSLGKIAHAVMGTTCARKRILLSRQVRSFLEDFLRKKTELR